MFKKLLELSIFLKTYFGIIFICKLVSFSKMISFDIYNYTNLSTCLGHVHSVSSIYWTPCKLKLECQYYISIIYELNAIKY